MPDDNNPLTDEDLEGLNDALGQLQRVDNLIDRMARAGIPVTDQRKRSAELRTKVAQLKQAFFPGR